MPADLHAQGLAVLDAYEAQLVTGWDAVAALELARTTDRDVAAAVIADLRAQVAALQREVGG